MKSIRIGTRKSPLALWQAEEVAKKIQNLGYTTEVIPIVSSGDKQLNQPLYAMGITGVFTRDLDIALLNDEIDIAVHSLKDVPTQLPENIELIAYLERDFPQDVLVRSSKAKDKALKDLKIATSSLRRRAFWLKNFPNTEFSDIRGNVQTRLNKLEEGIADATMFSKAGLERLQLNITTEELPMMVSAPSQGVVTVAGKADNEEIKSVLKQINHRETQICVEIERRFLQIMEGGCTAPIGALVSPINTTEYRFVGRICSLDGKECIEIDEVFSYENDKDFGRDFAEKVLANGGKKLMAEIKAQI
ncbi:MAG: hydroxymethylbilane synthase [Bergeyella zoohelcum]|nr:hydroxymethylbilane synthase [Bergeyella zoohelcum]